MTLIIGILVDDSIVVLENIERHREAGETPWEAAIKGRTQIGPAAIVITLVDVVVFLPIAFLPGTVGRFLIRVCTRRRSRDADLARRLVYDNAVVGRELVAAFESGNRRSRSRLRTRLRTPAPVVFAPRAPVGVAPAAARVRRLAPPRCGLSILLIPLGCGWIRVHSAGRSRRDLRSAHVSDGHASRDRQCGDRRNRPTLLGAPGHRFADVRWPAVRRLISAG